MRQTKTFWLPYSQMKNIKCPLPEVCKSKGSHLYLSNGQSVLDAVSSWWVITYGHNPPSIIKSLKSTLGTVDQILTANFRHRIMDDLLKEMESLLPNPLQYMFFSDNGSTAVEVAIKMALQSCLQKGEGRRRRFLSFKGSYHGDTLGAMSVTGPSVFNRPYKSLLFDVIFCGQGRKSTDPLSSWLSDFEKKIRLYKNDLAGVILEPLIQGAGGMIVWPRQAVNEIGRLTKKHGIYLIFDEVMTGFGRTGKTFAFEHLEVLPDILCLSKGLTGGILPLGLTVAQAPLFKSFLSPDKEKLFFHGHSFTANPLSVTAALASVKLIKQAKWKKEWKRIERFQQKKLNNMKNLPGVKDARGFGTMAALELSFKNKKKGYLSGFAETFTGKSLKEGVFLRPLGDVVYVLPPYCTTNKELEKIWNVIENEVKSIA